MAGHIVTFIVRMKIWKDNSGQDMLEYACFVAAISVQAASAASTS
jgi:Flp pilus assembly pilin Flp